MVTLEQVRASAAADIYPRHFLSGCKDALILFAAGFHGAQDAVWIADAGMTATCVDVDAKKMGEMTMAYPEGWEFVVGDAFEYATRTERQWDVVSIDCPTNLFDRCAELMPLWGQLAKWFVILGCGEETRLIEPNGWRVRQKLRRSNFNGGVYWAVYD